MNIQEKIAKIEALIAGATTRGEKEAAKEAKKRLLKKKSDRVVEYAVRVDSHWKKKLFVAFCRKHGLQTYRYRRQKHTTTMVRVSPTFMNEVIWPEYKKYGDMFEALAKEIFEELIGKIYHGDEAEMVIAGEIGSSEITIGM